MKRKIYDKLLNWKEKSQGETALLIAGARRVGKSYIARQFAQNEYKSFIFIDFNQTNAEIKALFENYLDDLDTFFMYLSAYTGIKLYQRQSVIVFDEVQMFPKARAAIKYLVEDGRYDYIETGSLMSIKQNVKDIVIPSEEEELEMYPMDFEEFLWAMGHETLMPFIKTCFEKKQAMGPLMHRKAMDFFRQYLIVGGMPQVVLTYQQTRDFELVDRAKRLILSLYRNDISKYAKGYEAKTTQVWDDIPAQLQKHEKKFRLSQLKKGARTRDYESSFFWLSDAMIVNMCYSATEPHLGLKLKKDSSSLKCYVADTGLLISLAFDEKGLVSEEIYQKIMRDQLEMNAGMIIENVVAQMLRTAGHRLYFYSNASPNKEDRMEIDFLIAKQKITSRHNISPIEVKSTKRYTLTSLKKCIAKFKNDLATPYVLHTGDFKEEEGILYLPLYMALLL